MNLVNHFVPLGYAVTGMDQIGHGRSAGERLYVERFEDYTRNMEIYVDIVRGQFPGKAMFIFGHSMGGLISTVYLIDHQEGLAGAILCAPVIHNSSNNPAVFFSGGLLSAVAPRFGLFYLDRRISRDPEWVKTAFADPLWPDKKIPARTGMAVLKGMRRVKAEAHQLTLPILILQGTADVLLNPVGAQRLFDWASSQDKQIKHYDGYFHELFNEPEPDRNLVLNDIALWLEERV
jgi:alpha-beta hydrolase superfamily lysophospholipase